MRLGRIVVDSLAELERVAEIAASRGETAKVMLRLTPGVHAHTHEFIATAHEDQKFGLSMAGDSTERGRAVRRRGSGGGRASGPTASNCWACTATSARRSSNPTASRSPRRSCSTFWPRCRRSTPIVLPELDLGGGYGIAYTPADTPRPPAEIAQAMAAVVRAKVAELGIDRAADLDRARPRDRRASTVHALRGRHAENRPRGRPGAASRAAPENVTYPRRYVSVDGGMSDNARPVLYDADYSAILASRDSDAAPQLSRVVGKHCESGDIVVRDVYLPEDVAAGDLLAVPGTGAYCWALSSNYNYLARPGVVAVRDGAARLIVRGETEEDLLEPRHGSGEC